MGSSSGNRKYSLDVEGLQGRSEIQGQKVLKLELRGVATPPEMVGYSERRLLQDQLKIRA